MKNLGLAKLLAERLYEDRYELMGITIAESMMEAHISTSSSLGAMAMVGRNYCNCDITHEKEMAVTQENVMATELETNRLAEEILLEIEDTIDGKSYSEIIGALYTLTLNMVKSRDEDMKEDREEQKEEKCSCERCSCDKDTKEEEVKENPLDFIINALQQAKKDGKLSIREIKL